MNREEATAYLGNRTEFLKPLYDLGAILSGGAILDIISEIPPKDYDLYFSKESDFEQCLAWMIKNGAKAVDSNRYTATFKHYGKTVQLIFKSYSEKMEDVINMFDFKNVMAAYNGRELVACAEFFQLHQDSEVKINCITNPLSSLQRLCKYSKRGYHYQKAYDYIVDLIYSRKGDSSVILNAKYY